MTSDADTCLVLAAFSHCDERWGDLDWAERDRSERIDRERCGEMSGAQIENAGERFAASDSDQPEIAVVGEDNAPSGVCVLQDPGVRLPVQTVIEDAVHIAAALPQPTDDFRVNVFVGQKRIGEQPHADTRRAQTCSPFNASAAY